MLGAFLFAYIIGSFSSILQNLSMETNIFEAKMRSVGDFLSHINADPELSSTVSYLLASSCAAFSEISCLDCCRFNDFTIFATRVEKEDLIFWMNFRFNCRCANGNSLILHPHTFTTICGGLFVQADLIRQKFEHLINHVPYFASMNEHALVEVCRSRSVP